VGRSGNNPVDFDAEGKPDIYQARAVSARSGYKPADQQGLMAIKTEVGAASSRTCKASSPTSWRLLLGAEQ
jgi:hypothetical protein